CLRLVGKHHDCPNICPNSGTHETIKDRLVVAVVGERSRDDDWAFSALQHKLVLVAQIVDAVSVPVLAAGGIADGRGIAAAFALGAAGTQIGAAFLCPE